MKIINERKVGDANYEINITGQCWDEHFIYYFIFTFNKEKNK